MIWQVRHTAVVAEHPPLGSKADWRRHLRARRRSRPAGAHDHIRDENAARTVLQDRRVLSVLEPGCSTAVYVALAHEPPTSALRHQLRNSGTAVFVPWARPDRRLLWVPDDGNAHAWGVPGQPEPPVGEIGRTIDDVMDLRLLVIPALAATSAGARLGQGGGYYDTLLANVPPFTAGGPLRVVLVGRDELFEEVPTEPHDARVDVVLIV